MPRRDYRLNDGTKVPGVTTIIGRFKESGGLLWWANRLAYDPLGRAYSLLGKAYEALYNGPSEALLANIADFLETPLESYDHNKVRDAAADAGTLAHAMAEAYLKGGDPDAVLEESGADKDVRGRAETAFLAFLEWAQQTNLEVVESELSLVSESDRVGGTLDAAVVKVNGKVCIGDFKTGKAIYVDALVQVAQYGKMYAEAGGVDLHGYYIIRFDKETADFTVRFFNDLSDGVRAFALMRELYDVMKDLQKRVK